MRHHLLFTAYSLFVLVSLILVTLIENSPSALCQAELRGLAGVAGVAIPPTLGSSPTPQGGENSSNPTGVSSAPGADAMMTPDLLLVSPNKSGQAPQPLQTFVGTTLKMAIDRNDIVLNGLQGLMITVTNDTNRSLVIDGDNAKAMTSGKTYPAIPVAVLQKRILPNPSLAAKTGRTVTHVVPAFLTIGAVPTVRDYITMTKPIHKRYGVDEKRRLVEASRFGRRILWPHQKTQGVVYFQTADAINKAKVEVPVHTLFDKPDNCLITSG